MEQGRRGPSTSPPGRDPASNRGVDAPGTVGAPRARNARQGSVRSAKHVESRAGTVAVIAIRGNPDSATGRSRQANCTGSPSVAMAAMAAYRLSGRAALGAAHGPFSGSPPCSLAPGCACWPRLVRSALRGSGPVADRGRPAPDCATRRSSDSWSPDRQRLGNGTASGHWIENLAAELLGITFGTDTAPSTDVVTGSQTNRLRTTRAHQSPDVAGRFRN